MPEKLPDDKDRPKSGWAVNFIKKSYRKLIKLQGTPHQIAAGFGLGVFLGMTPLLGIQMAIAVFFALLLNWNKVSSALGVWISNPLTIPFIYPVTYIVGVKIMGTKTKEAVPIAAEPSFNIFQNAPEIFWVLILGGIVLGIPLSLTAYWFAFKAVKKYQEDIKQKFAEKHIIAGTKEKLHKIKEIRKKKSDSKKT